MKIDEVIKSSSGGNGIDIILVLVKILRTKTVVEKRIILSTTTIERATMMGLKEIDDSYSTIIVVAKDYFIYFFSMYSFNSNNA